jgi:agmatinase
MVPIHLLLVISVLSSSIWTREIIFPPIAAVVRPNGHSPQYMIANSDDYLEQPGEFAGLSTYANLPFVHCTSAGAVEAYDIAVLGAPFDTATTGRPGARFGPHGIRDGSRRIMSAFAWSAYTDRNTFEEWARIVDCGDAPLTFLDNTVALKQLERAHKATSGRTANATARSETPRIITLGGDHTTTLAALRATVGHWGPVSVIHFDSHLDTWDPLVLGGGLSHYAGVNHGTFLHLAHEEGLILNTSIHAGIRAPLGSKKGDLRNDARCGFEIVKARDIDRIGVSGVIERLKKRVGESKVYISVDIDVLDPAFAPGMFLVHCGMVLTPANP